MKDLIGRGVTRNPQKMLEEMKKTASKKRGCEGDLIETSRVAAYIKANVDQSIADGKLLKERKKENKRLATLAAMSHKFPELDILAQIANHRLPQEISKKDLMHIERYSGGKSGLHVLCDKTNHLKILQNKKIYIAVRIKPIIFFFSKII